MPSGSFLLCLVRVLPRGSFVVLWPDIAGPSRKTTLLQNDQLATPPPACSYCAGVATSCFCYGGGTFLLFLCQNIKQMPCQFWKILLFQWLTKNVAFLPGGYREIFVTAEPASCYGGNTLQRMGRRGGRVLPRDVQGCRVPPWISWRRCWRWPCAAECPGAADVPTDTCG